MSYINNWGANKGLKDLHSVLGHTSEALKFVKEWADICKRLNPTPANIERQNACVEKINAFVKERVEK